jgi:protein-S-isoprenylcysteine O-methyltransferase Ste14
MLLPLFVTLLPTLFLAGLVQRALAFRRRHVDMDGVPPISIPILLVVAVYAIAVHHRIVLAEEAQLGQVFGQEYRTYCSRVPRYL